MDGEFKDEIFKSFENCSYKDTVFYSKRNFFFFYKGNPFIDTFNRDRSFFGKTGS